MLHQIERSENIRKEDNSKELYVGLPIFIFIYIINWQSFYENIKKLYTRKTCHQQRL